MLRAFFLGESFPNDVNILVALVGDGYTYDSSHSTLADVVDVIAAVPIPDVTISSLAVVDAPDMVPAFTELGTGDNVKALVLYAEDSVSNDTQLIGYMDSAVQGSIPFVISQDELIIRWPSGGIFGI